MRSPRAFALVGIAALLPACASDSSRDYEAFSGSHGLDVEAPPERTGGEEQAPAKRPAAGLRISQGLTLEEAERIALEANPNVAVAVEAVNAAKANVWQQSLLTNPVFSVGQSEFSTSGFSPGNTNPSQTQPLTSDNFSRSFGAWDIRASSKPFTLQKDFDVSGKRVARVDGAIESERQQEAQYASAARQLKAQVRTTYAAVLVAEKGLELAREAAEMAQMNVDILGTGAIGGKVFEGDSATAQSAADRARIDQKQAELNLANAKVNLAALLGSPEATLGPLRGSLPLETLAPDTDAAVVVQDALEHDADVVAAKRAVLAADANLRLQKRSMVPDLTLQGTYNLYVLDRINTFGFDVSVPLPVFDQNRAQIALAVAGIHEAEAQQRATELTVEQGVRADLLQIATSRARIDAFEKEILPGARKAVKLNEVSFEGGKVLYLSVIAARQNFNQQRQDYATELLNYETAMADLERLLGHPVAGRAP